ncbi:MAG: adenylosuccinate lyase [Nanoarchaeota archaeon]|nr:adenylosuccinate lyase [Nanoarchaeota archaeon]
MEILNILADRYASKSMKAIFDEERHIIEERRLWIAVMKAQRELGVNIPAEAIEKYEAVKEHINFESIRERERKKKHDVDARAEEFNTLAGYQYAHNAMTSRDDTDNIEQMQIKQASKLIHGKFVSILRHFVEKAEHYQHIILTARTHHQAAQPTLLGRRMAMWAQELLCHIDNYEHMIENLPLRGIKGPVGTQFDMLTLLGSEEKVLELERRVAQHLGFTHVLHAVGQVYPRSLDYALINRLSETAAACENFSTGMRLMAGYELVTEGFKEGQVGSSAMPHKMNTRSSERIWGAAQLIKGYQDMASRISGAQWEEGDVSCSIVRRVIDSDTFFAADALCETTLTVLNKMGAYPVIISREVDRYLPFLATTEILTRAIKAGIGRETAHATIKKYAVAEALAMRTEGRAPALATRLAEDPVFQEKGITQTDLEDILKEKEHFLGRARQQIQAVKTDAQLIFDCYPQAAAYEPGDIL